MAKGSLSPRLRRAAFDSWGSWCDCGLVPGWRSGRAVCAPDAVHTRLAALQAWLDAHANHVIIVVCGGLGLWLTAQGIYTLTTA